MLVKLASLYAAAVAALGLSMREYGRGKYAPSSGLLARSAAAASLTARAARLTTRLVLPRTFFVAPSA